jgi:glycerophosphoryl diester phosphodiesterase
MTQIWAHRGARREAPENTLPAFELAVAQGADGVEFDVQLTADGTVVVIHDETVERTTNGTGPVVGFGLAELRGLDASAGFGGYTGVQIPTLADTLALLAPPA